MNETIHRVTQAEELPNKFFFKGYLNVDFEVLSHITLDEIFWIYTDANHHAQQAGGLINDCLFYQVEDKIIVIKSHFGTSDLHLDYLMARRDMTEGFVTIKMGKKKSTYQVEEYESASKRETLYFFDGLPKPSDKVAQTLQPQGVLELMLSVQAEARSKGGMQTPVFEDHWMGHTFRLVDNMPSKYLEKETELSKLASAIHFVTIDLIEEEQKAD